MELKALREALDLTMKQVGDRCGISESHYCLIERGQRRPSPEVAKRIAAVLGFEWTRFFEDESPADSA